MKPRPWKRARLLRCVRVMCSKKFLRSLSVHLSWRKASRSSAVEQTASTDKVGRSIKDFTGGAVATQKATDSARVTVEDMAKLAETLTASVSQFKLV